MTEISQLGSDVVIFSVLAFVVGMASMIVYSKVKGLWADRRYRTDEAIVEAVVLEYTRRLHDYDKVLANLQADIEIMQLKSQPGQSTTSQYHTSQDQTHVAGTRDITRDITSHITHHTSHHATEEMENNGTMDYILKLLAERPRTSREVQEAIGRTREHTARLLKKLHDTGTVGRNLDKKPFRYTITNAGLERLKEKAATQPPVA